MSEFIVIQVGQCGNQIGSYLLPEILHEYGIKTSNEPSHKVKHDRPDLQDCLSSFFNVNSRNNTSFNILGDLVYYKIKARFLCIDMEDSVVARFKNGKFRNLYDQRNMITNYPGSANNWAEGYHSHGPKFKQKILRAVQHNVEKCDNLSGFILLLSMGGGTGSGLGTYVLKSLYDNYPTIERFVICVYPIGTEDVITAPYNMALATQQLLDHATCVFPVENRTLFDITKRQMGRYFSKVSPYEPFEDVNKIIVDMVLHLTSGSRFGGKLNMDINEINTNMVPFPKLNFLSSGFSPLKLKYAKDDTTDMKNELFLSACSRNNQLLKSDPLNSRFVSMGVTLLGRGNFSINDMRNYIGKLRCKLSFPPWSSKAVKVGMCDVPPKALECSMFSLSNTTSIAYLFDEVRTQFVKLYKRKAHIHHYTAVPGFDIECFRECQNDLKSIIQLYSEIEKMN